MQRYKFFVYFYIVKAVFIKLSKEMPMYRNGYGMRIFNFRGVRLLPNQENAYIQRTDISDGINFDSPTVEALSPCGDVLADLTLNFEQIQSFDDPDTGFTQVYWGLKDLPDLGDQLIYLRITNGADGIVYSTPFVIHGYEQDEVPPYRFDYREEENDVMQSIGLDLYYYKDAEIFEQESFDTVGGDNRVVLSSKLIEYEVCRSGIVDYKIFRLFKRMMCFSEKYCEYQKVTLLDTFDTPDFAGDENFVQEDINLLRDSSVVYDPNYIPPAPPPPPPYSILLQSITPNSPTEVNYTFEVDGFSPTYLNYQYSLDGINWSDNTSGVTSPQSKVVPNYSSNNYYYRITARPAFEEDSNILQMSTPEIVLWRVYSTDSEFSPTGNKYYFVFELNGFNPTILLQFQYSVDGIIWQTILNNVGDTNDSPRFVVSTPSSQERQYFRIRYPLLNLTSNVYFYEI